MRIHVWTFKTNLERVKKTLKVNDFDTVEDLKTKIQDKMGIECGQQRLIYCGNTLEDYKTLSSYRIDDGSNISIVKRWCSK